MRPMQARTSLSLRRALLLALGLPLACAWSAEHVHGSGHRSEETRKLSDYRRVAVKGTLHVVLRQDGHEGVELEGDDNLLPLVQTKLRDRTLEIGLKDDTEVREGELTITVHLIGLQLLSQAGAGRIEADGLIAPQLDVATGGSGRTELRGLQAGSLGISLGGSASLLATGQARRVNVALGGSGSVLADGLQADEVSVTVGGSGKAEVQAQKRLKVLIAGSGSVTYRGDAKVESHALGSGQLIKR